MEWWQYALLSLPWRARFELAGRLVADERMPLPVRAIPALLVLYLAMPLDFVPDFIPILGQLDDVAVVIVAVGLFARFAPVRIIEEHIGALESETGLRQASG
jgi:uncharacterized membrane protein YkvA (DUF1232 family)